MGATTHGRVAALAVALITAKHAVQPIVDCAVALLTLIVATESGVP